MVKDKDEPDGSQETLDTFFETEIKEEPSKSKKQVIEDSRSPSKQGKSSKEKSTIVILDDEEEEILEEMEFDETSLDFSTGNRDTPTNLPPSILLSVDYAGPEKKAFARLYNPSTKKLSFWFDNTGHQPYCYTDYPTQAVDYKLQHFRGPYRTETTKVTDLLLDKEKQMTKVIAEDPLSIGGHAGSIREMLVDKAPDGTTISHAWEANIRYRNCYSYDRELVPGLHYKIEDGMLIPSPPEVDSDILEKFKAMFAGEEMFKDILDTYAPMFFTEVPDIRRIALDIEVYTPKQNRVPDANTAPYEITAIGLSDNEGFNKCFVLKRDNIPLGDKGPEYPENLDIVFFESEAQMILETFRIIDSYPIVLTFVGDAFDLNYLYHRAERLNIDMRKHCPIYLGRDIALLQRGIHIDLYRFLKNPSIRLYALSGAYERNNLDSIALGLLDVGKLELSTEISKLPYFELAHYCWLDANITLRITQYDENLVLRLIILLMRISRLSMEDITRFGISSWIQSLFRQVHRSNDYLIPRQQDIESVKATEAQTEAMIKDKRFKGAIVIEPVAGVHFDATVLDFASLYPTIMKRHNISYETVDCSHESCKSRTDNRVPETNHWVCRERTGMISQTIGFFRDTRVNWFKSKSKDSKLDPKIRNWYKVVEKALKVFVNACLPYDEEVIVCDKEGTISKIPVGSLSDRWKDLQILSIDNDWESPTFGKSVFVPIKGFKRSGKARVLTIRFRDGRTIRCTPNHVIPKLLPKHTRTGQKRITRDHLKIRYVAAEDLKVNDELLIHTRIPLTSNPPETLFIPDYIETDTLDVGIKKRDYCKHSDRGTQKCEHPVIEVVNKEFRYSKEKKWYRAKWDSLSDRAKEILRTEISKSIPLYGKLIENGDRCGEASKWHNLRVNLDDTFFKLLGWYLSEGSTFVNRTSISQHLEANPVYSHEIGSLLTRMEAPFTFYSAKDHVIHSKVLDALIESICDTGSSTKRIPIELLDSRRAKILLDTFFKGEDNFNSLGARRYSTSSKSLASDVLVLLGSLGIHASVHNEEDMFCIVERKGLKYARTEHGLVDFHGTFPVQIRSIETSYGEEDTFDLETQNGLFVATHGVVVHNSYGVTGAQHFELFCMPAAESVTAYGRHAIIKTKEKAESMGVRVLYGDTDSVFLDAPTKEQQKELIEWSRTDLGIDLEVEKTYKYVALSDRKKNYIGVYKSGYVEVKGLSGKKRNTPDFVQDAFRDMLEILSRVNSPDGFETAKEEIREVVNDVLDRLEGKAEPYSPSDLAFRVQMTKEVSKYGKVKPQHVRAAMMMEDAGYEVPAGTIIEYIKTKDNDGVIPVPIAEQKSYWLDKEKYMDTLRSVFGQVLESVGIDFEELLGFTTLDQFF